MGGFTIYVLLAGTGATFVGLLLQAAGRALFSRYKRDDTKELAGVVGLRVSAIFGIAVGLIFASSAAHLMEAKRNLMEEARLIGTLNFLAAEAPELENRGQVQERLRDFAERSVRELQEPNGIDGAARVTNHMLLQICREMALEDQDSASVRWTKAEFQRSCSKLIDLRGAKRVGARETLIAKPFWIFFGISFGFLAFLFGVFEPRPLNVVFACLFYFATGVTGMIIFAASDPYHEPGRISSLPLERLLPEPVPAPGAAP
jgi:hypothetical protein